MRISDWSSDVCSSDLLQRQHRKRRLDRPGGGQGVADHRFVRAHWNFPGQIAEHVLDAHGLQARKSVVSGKSVSVRVDLGGRRILKKKIYNIIYQVSYNDNLST